MKQWIYKARPPYPKDKWNKYVMFGVCYLIIASKKIDFSNDLLWFEVNYQNGGRSFGSVSAYRQTSQDDKHIFRFTVTEDCEFTITIKGDFDLSDLTVKFAKIEDSRIFDEK